MRALWAGATVTHRGRIIVEHAKLYTRPERPPLVFGSALTPATARWVGSWADGLITTGMPSAGLRAVLDAFREGGGSGKPVKVQAALGWAETDAEARSRAHRQWAANVAGPDVLPDVRTPSQFAEIAARISPGDVAEALPVTADLARHAARLRTFVD